MKRCPFLQAPCCESECMLWNETCAIVEISENMQQLHTATSAVWNHLRGGQNPAFRSPFSKSLSSHRPAVS